MNEHLIKKNSYGPLFAMCTPSPDAKDIFSRGGAKYFRGVGQAVKNMLEITGREMGIVHCSYSL